MNVSPKNAARIRRGSFCLRNSTGLAKKMTIVTDKERGFRLRFCIRIAPQFMETADVVRTTVAGTEVVIKSKHGGPPAGTDWIVLEASGFPTKESAREYGARLRMIVRLTGMCSGPGVDTGRDSPTSHWNGRSHDRDRPYAARPDNGARCTRHIRLPGRRKLRSFAGRTSSITVESSSTNFAKALRHISNQETRQLTLISQLRSYC